MESNVVMPRRISWALRVTAGLLLAYMAILLGLEISSLLGTYFNFTPFTEGWAQGWFVLLYLVNTAILMVWCGFANRALQSFAQPGLKTRPLMAALWFIVPGAFVFMPWPVVREVYLASREPASWEDAKAPIIGWWWCARVVSGFAFWAVCDLSYPDDPGLSRTLLFQALIVAELGMQILLVTRVTRWQRLSLRQSVAHLF